MKVYRIYAEDISNVEEQAIRYFDACTVFYGRGGWEGLAENSIVVEVIDPAQGKTAIQEFAKAVQVANEQEAVLVTCQDVEFELIV